MGDLVDDTVCVRDLVEGRLWEGVRVAERHTQPAPVQGIAVTVTVAVEVTVDVAVTVEVTVEVAVMIEVTVAVTVAVTVT